MFFILGPSVLMLFFIRYLFYLYTYEKPNEIVIIDPIDVYVSKHKKKLLKTYKNDKNMSCNIEREFYTKKDYTAVMKVADNEIETAWRTRILHEYTPKGIIVMNYDAYKQGFSYYAEQSCIPHTLLNAVAMKYVTIFFCRDFYFDEDTFLEKLIIESEKTDNKTDNKTDDDNEEMVMRTGTYLSPLIKIHNESDKTKEKVAIKKMLSDAPFAKLKTKSNNNSSKDKKKQVEKSKHNNKFICLGKTYNLTLLQKNVKSKINNTTGYDAMFAKSKESIIGTKMSYKNFKKNNDKPTKI